MANPHSERRMEYILERVVKEEEAKEDDNSEEKDEVSVIFYGEEAEEEEKQCNCTKNSTCRTNKCICFLCQNKCSIFVITKLTAQNAKIDKKNKLSLAQISLGFLKRSIQLKSC